MRVKARAYVTRACSIRTHRSAVASASPCPTRPASARRAPSGGRCAALLLLVSSFLHCSPLLTLSSAIDGPLGDGAMQRAAERPPLCVPQAPRRSAVVIRLTRPQSVRSLVRSLPHRRRLRALRLLLPAQARSEGRPEILHVLRCVQLSGRAARLAHASLQRATCPAPAAAVRATAQRSASQQR